MSSELKDCISCGMCKKACPAFKELLKETNSPRGYALQMKKEVLTKELLKCTLCKACKVSCPADIDLPFVKNRAKLLEKFQTDSQRKMIKNIREHGNPFGEIKKGDKPKELFCC